MSFIESAKLAIPMIEKWLDFKTWIDELPGVAVGISVDDEVIFTRGYGVKNLVSRAPVSPGTLFRIASHSKLFTASAIMKLYADKKLRLDDHVVDHLLWFSSEADPNMAYVTIRELLSHSSGMNRDGNTGHWQNDQFPDLESIQSQAGAGLSSFDGGEHWKYSNMGFTVLGQIIEAVTGLSYEDAVTEIVLEPMGLKDTHPDIKPDRLIDHATGYGRRYPGEAREQFDQVHARVMNSATGFSSNVDNLLRFFSFHQFGNETFLADRYKREMQRVQFQDGTYQWGLGFAVDKVGNTEFVGHGGGYPGFLTQSTMIQKKKLTIVVLTNSLDGNPQGLTTGISGLLHYVAKNEAAWSLTNESPAEFYDKISGFYGNRRWGIQLLQRIGGRMTSLAPSVINPAETVSRLDDLGNKSFRVSDGPQNGAFGEQMTVIKDAKGYKLQSGLLQIPPFTFTR